MTTATFDMPKALAMIDDWGKRSALRTANRYYARCKRAYRAGRRSVYDDDLWDDVRRTLQRAMAAAHAKAQSMWHQHRSSRLSMDRKEVRRLLRNVAPTQRAAIDSFYGKIARTVVRGAMTSVRDRLLGQVADLVNDRPRAYRRDLRSMLQRIGISHDAGHLVQTTVRTQSALAFNAASWVEGQDEQELWGYEYSTAGDERVRETHVPFDGVRYAKDDAFWKKYAPPNGWNCRCTLNPIYVGDPLASEKPFKGTPEVDAEFMFNPGALFTMR